jgi:hypothetical protein
LEELCHAKEQRSGLLSGEGLSDIKQEHNSGQERSAFAGRDGWFVEDSRFLDDDGFVVVEGWVAQIEG